MKLSVIGEFGLVERIRRSLPRASDALLGIGDDCAALRPRDGRDLLLTTDLLVEGVDFANQTITPFRLGRRAMGVNLSDIAAMGGLPRAALVALALPAEMHTEFVDQLYRGLQDEAARFGVELIGGDLSASPTLLIAITLVGEVESGRAITRSGAKSGERIWITGRLGASAAGLMALNAGFRLRDDDRLEVPSQISAELTGAIREAIDRHLCPTPRVREGRAIAEAGFASAMIDLSDGLASDLGHLCRESGVSARIREDRIPVDPAASAIGRHLGKDPMTLALEGGEDFELLFTSSSESAEILELFSGGLEVTDVGLIERAGQECVLVQRDDRVVRLSGGYDHFRSQ